MSYINSNGERHYCPSERSTCKDCGCAVLKRGNTKNQQRCWKCWKTFIRANPELCGAFKTGKSITGEGYVVISAKNHPHCRSNGRMLEHRFVMEQKLGRYLKPSEIVHHLDGVKTNNHPSNLVVCKSDREHFDYHARTCIVCGGGHYGKGFCSSHYGKWMRLGYSTRGIKENGKWFKPLPTVAGRWKNHTPKSRKASTRRGLRSAQE